MKLNLELKKELLCVGDVVLLLNIDGYVDNSYIVISDSDRYKLLDIDTCKTSLNLNESTLDELMSALVKQFSHLHTIKIVRGEKVELTVK